VNNYVNQQLEIALEDNQISTALITDSQYHEPVCLAVFGISSYLEQYTSHLKRFHICPSRFFNTNDENKANEQTHASSSDTVRKQ